MPVLSFHDAAASQNVSNLFEELEKTLYTMPFATKKSDALIPKGPPLPRGVQHYTYPKATGVGMAAIMDDHSDNIPSVDEAIEEVSVSVHSALTHYGYSVSDLEAAQYASINLDQTKAMMAREAVDSSIDNFRLVGLNGKNGLINNENITVTTAEKKITAMTSFDEVSALFRDVILNGVNKVNKDTVKVNTVVFPRSVMNMLTTKTYSQYDSETWLVKLKGMFPDITTWEFLDELETAGVGKTCRLIVYAMNPLYGRTRPQIPFETQPTQYNKYKYETYCRGTTGGFDVIRPTAFMYVDNV